MIYKNMEFHNVDHLEQVPGMNGLKLHRFPEHFSKELGITKNHNGRFRAERPHGCEIRFVTEAEYFDIALTAMEADIDIILYYGDFMHSKHTLKAGVCTVLHVSNPEIYNTIEKNKLPKARFAPNVWRILFGLNGYVYFNYLNTFGCSYRPPYASEKPEKVWAAYGSSITCGSVTSLYSNCYINQAAIRLGYDVLNKGLSGSCLCEKIVIDYLSELKVDLLSMEIGVNMVLFFDEREFRDRTEYLLSKILTSPAKEIYIITMFPNKGLIAKDVHSKYYVHYRAFNKAVIEIMKDVKDSRIKLISGEDILKDFTYLSTDLLHPSDNGHIRMGEHLAKMMKEG